MREATKILRAMVTPAVAGMPLYEGPVFAAPFHVPGAVGEAAYSYAGYQQPSWTTLERVLGVIETGDGLPGGVEAKALCFASGAAATMAVFGAVLRPGDAVVLPAGAYFNSRKLVEGYFGTIGVEMRLAPTAGEAQGELLEGARLLWIETPSNPGIEVCDIAALCERARGAGVLVACDNSMATPLGQNVLSLGADFSVVSDTKLMTGHSDVLMGHVAVTDEAWYARLLEWRHLAGGGPGPMEAWLATRSLATLSLRLERSSANALRVAEWLEGRPEVSLVRYPGLRSHESYEIAVRQMRSFGPVVSFVLRGGEAAAERFLSETEVVTNATSFGGIATTAERRARWGHDAIDPGFVRMSVGCEAVEDLLEDFRRGLEV